LNLLFAFGMGTSSEMAKAFDTELMAQIPIEPAIRIGGDTGKPVVYTRDDVYGFAYGRGAIAHLERFDDYESH